MGDPVYRCVSGAILEFSNSLKMYLTHNKRENKANVESDFLSLLMMQIVY